ncbi:MAG: pyridoxamine 5'-phosphate oxidase family protein, partial [Chloroflexi bacterium]|nr:pyridoxamine 5'-phosphate oxidase family protein [Chloroflexota bacterium]
QERSAIRYRKRSVEDENWIKAFLKRAAFGVLATSYNDQPFTNTNLFVYDEAQGCIYLHTALTGRTRTNVEHNPNVCFTVSEMGRLLPADVALEFSVEYAGVVVFGRANLLEEETAKTHALQMLLDKYAPHLQRGHDYRAITAAELARTAVYQIDIEEWSGKLKQVDPDFPGAYSYRPKD